MVLKIIPRGVTTNSRSPSSYTMQEIGDGVDGLMLIAVLTKPDDYAGSFVVGGGKSLSVASSRRRRRSSKREYSFYQLTMGRIWS